MAAKCSICNNKKKKAVDQMIADGVSLRDIPRQLGLKHSKDTIWRHATNCLGVDIGAIMIEKKIESKLNAMEALEGHMAKLVQLRDTLFDFLSDPDNPLQLTLDPWAQEIEVIHFDLTDTTGGDNPQPKRKRTQLSTLLAMLQLGPAQEFDDDTHREVTRLRLLDKVQDIDEPEFNKVFAETWDAAKSYFMHVRQSLDRKAEKVHVKHVDLRTLMTQYANMVESCIDKLLKIEGLYKEKAPNDSRAAAVDAVRSLMQIMGLPMKEAMETILRVQREMNMQMVDPVTMREVARINGIMELEGVQ